MHSIDAKRKTSTLGPYLSDPPRDAVRMKKTSNELSAADSREAIWQTLAGCAVFGAGLLALCCMLCG